MINRFKIPLYILSLITMTISSICSAPTYAFVLNFSNLDDLDDSSVGEGFPPNSIDEGIFQSDSDLFFFKEQSNLTLTSALRVDADQPGTYNSNNEIPSTIAAGTSIDSYYFSFDIPNNIQKSTSDLAEIEFSQPILGIIYLRNSLDRTDSVLQRTGITYPTSSTLSRGVEKDNPGITWENDNVNLSAQVFVTNNNNVRIDHFRVITASDIPFDFSPTLGLIIVFGIFSVTKIVSKFLSL